MFAQGKVTIDRNIIRKWAQARHGWPALVKKVTSAGIEMVLSFVFPDNEPLETVRKISWEEFFEKFDQQHLAFVYQESDRNRELSYYYEFI